MFTIANKVAFWAVKKEYIDKDEQDLVRFGVELVLSQFITFLPMILYGYIFNKIESTAIFLTLFCSLRLTSDGYHAKTFKNCFLLTNSIYLICVELSPLLRELTAFHYTIICISTYLSISFLIKCLTPKLKNYLHCAIVLIASLFLLFELLSSEYSNHLTVGISVLCIINIVTYIKIKKGGSENEINIFNVEEHCI